MKSKIYIILVLMGFFLCLEPLNAQVTPCQAPTGTATSNINSSGATASWNVVTTAVVYNVRYRVTPGPNNQWITISVLNSPAVLANLLCNTGYEWQVQAGCPGLNGGIVLSNFTSSKLFTTSACSNACPVPGGLYTNNITNTTAKLHWNTTGAGLYRVRYRQVGTSVWLFKYPTATNVTVTALTSNTAYEWQVRSKCTTPAGYTLSNWSNISVFQTTGLNSCPAPTGLTSGTSGSINARQLQWNTTGASSYNIRYRPSNTATWLSTTSNTNSKLLTGLSPNVSYEWQVQSVCIVNGTITLSPWSVSAYFSNPAPLDLSPNPASDQMRIKYNADNDEAITITVCDFMGVPAFTKQHNATSGENEYNIDVSNYKTGIYYLTLTGPQGQKAVKFCVKR